MGSNPNKRRLRIEALENRYVFSVGMFADLDTWGHESKWASSPIQLVESGSNLYFFSPDPANHFQLWKTDSSVGKKSLVSGFEEGSPYEGAGGLTDVNGMLYFLRWNYDSDTNSLWKTDGSNTVLIKEFAWNHGNSAMAGFWPVGSEVLAKCCFSPMMRQMAVNYG
jgi:hypothetical protein